MRRDMVSRQPCRRLELRFAKKPTDGLRAHRHETARTPQSNPATHNSIPYPLCHVYVFGHAA